MKRIGIVFGVALVAGLTAMGQNVQKVNKYLDKGEE